jgi:hypothetical protein
VAQRFLAWRAVDGALEAQVAIATLAALGDEDLFAGLQQFVHHLAGVGVADDGTDRHLENDVVALATEHIGAFAVLAALGFKTAVVTVVDQGVEVVVGQRPHRATPATIAAIGAAEFLVFLVPEGRTAVATVPSGNIDISFVNEFHGCYCP